MDIVFGSYFWNQLLQALTRRPAEEISYNWLIGLYTNDLTPTPDTPVSAFVPPPTMPPFNMWYISYGETEVSTKENWWEIFQFQNAYQVLVDTTIVGFYAWTEVDDQENPIPPTLMMAGRWTPPHTWKAGEFPNYEFTGYFGIKPGTNKWHSTLRVIVPGRDE